MRKIMIVTLAVLLVGMFTAGNLFAGESKTCSGSIKAGCKLTPEQCAKLCGKSGKDAKLTPEECAKLCGMKCDKDSKCELTTFSVKGMTCGGCENSVKAVLTKVDGVCKVISISHKDGVANVCYDANKTSSDALASVITNKGYAAEVMPTAAITDAPKAGCKPGCKTASAGCSKAKGAAKTKGKVEGPH